MRGCPPLPQGLPESGGREDERLTAILDAVTKVKGCYEGKRVTVRGLTPSRSPAVGGGGLLYSLICMINFLLQIPIGFSYLVARKGDEEEGRGPPTKGWAGEILSLSGGSSDPNLALRLYSHVVCNLIRVTGWWERLSGLGGGGEIELPKWLLPLLGGGRPGGRGEGRGGGGIVRAAAAASSARPPP